MSLGSDRWRGAAILRGGKGYVPTPMGQVHYRDLGPHDGRAPILLLHMTPMSIVQFAEAQNTLAELGIRSIAVDTPGYGLSDPPPSTAPPIAAFADNLIAVLDGLKIDKVVVAGHHTGACIASSFAVRHSGRVAAVILHGVPMFNEEEIAARLNRPLGDRTPKEDGTHMSTYFRPGFGGTQIKTEAYLEAQTWFSVSIFMQGPDVGHHAVYQYDMESDLKKIISPGMIISDLRDSTYAVDLRAAALRPDFRYREFADDGSMSIMMHPAKWARLLADFYGNSIKPV